MHTSPFRRYLVAAIWGFPLALVGLAAPSADAFDFKRLKPTVLGSGDVGEERREVGSPDRLRLSTGARVVLRQGERFSLSIQAEGNVLPLISTRLENGILVVEDERPFKSSSAVVTIVLPRLAALETTAQVAVLAERAETALTLPEHGG